MLQHEAWKGELPAECGLIWSFLTALPRKHELDRSWRARGKSEQGLLANASVRGTSRQGGAKSRVWRLLFRSPSRGPRHCLRHVPSAFLPHKILAHGVPVLTPALATARMARGILGQRGVVHACISLLGSHVHSQESRVSASAERAMWRRRNHRTSLPAERLDSHKPDLPAILG